MYHTDAGTSHLIRLQRVTKSFEHAGSRFTAVDAVSLDIHRGEIFGIMGQSGAGKSTLLRTINLLERPESGTVEVDGVDMMALKKRGLRDKRQSIGMIFQQFNLLQNANVFENVAFPLRLRKTHRDEVKLRVNQCLSIVGLTDKIANYPAQLSGGQKQRVAIARALATEPAVMLCDEPTSALDAETAETVMEVLRDVNQRLGVTIVIVTHQIDVVRLLCHRMAEMRQGKIVRESRLDQPSHASEGSTFINRFVLSTTGRPTESNLSSSSASSLHLVGG
jgi:D-methionine transport system ATP-binding protein